MHKIKCQNKSQWNCMVILTKGFCSDILALLFGLKLIKKNYSKIITFFIETNLI